MKWEILSELATSGEEVQKNDVVNALLENRRLVTEKEKKEFFEPKDPKKISLREFGLKKAEMKKAVERIKRAAKDKEKVVVFGDYDADGVTATAVMWEALNAMGVDVIPYIPNRVSEGYGINADGIEKIKSQFPKVKLIVTVDNGIVAVDAVKAAKDHGIDVIVTDHHSIGEELPEAVAIVHSTKTSGVGVAWLVARELGYKGNLELVAVGTVADQIPLVGVNRSLVKYGLGELNETTRLGLVVLLEKVGVEKGVLGISTINFQIAPRINAMGRLGEAMDSLRMLCTRRQERAVELVEKMQATNQERQRVVEEAVGHAKQQVSKKMLGGGIVVVGHESYHEGVIGLIASALVERHYRPAVVFSVGDDVAKASARSITGFNMIETVRQLDKYLLTGGGHPMAAGFSVETAKLAEFTEKLGEIAKPLLVEEILSRSMWVDVEIGFGSVGWELVQELEKFGPFGLGNPRPVFCSRGVKIKEMRGVGEGGKHLKLALVQGGREYGAIGFGFGKLVGEVGEGESIDVAYSLERNVWNGRESIQMKIKDVKREE